MTPEDAKRERGRLYYLANREKVLARTAARKREKAELVREESRRWYQANRDKKLAQNREWTAANKERHAALSATWVAANQDRKRASKRAWANENREKLREQDRALYAANPERVISRKRAAYARNPEKEKARTKNWQQRNRALVTFFGSLRRAAELQAMPKWLTAEQRDQIRAIYVAARERGMVVDHIVPLRGKTVCGLHLPHNLQLLTREENSRKHNKLLPAAALDAVS